MLKFIKIGSAILTIKRNGTNINIQYLILYIHHTLSFIINIYTNKHCIATDSQYVIEVKLLLQQDQFCSCSVGSLGTKVH